MPLKMVSPAGHSCWEYFIGPHHPPQCGIFTRKCQHYTNTSESWSSSSRMSIGQFMSTHFTAIISVAKSSLILSKWAKRNIISAKSKVITCCQLQNCMTWTNWFRPINPKSCDHGLTLLYWTSASENSALQNVSNENHFISSVGRVQARTSFFKWRN